MDEKDKKSQSRFKRIKRNPTKFETLDLYRMAAVKEGYSFSDPDNSHKFITKVEEEFNKAKSSSTTLHGLKTQALFEYVAASLGNCAVIKSEDSGDISTDVENLNVPDFRILLQNGQQFLVEVKNFHQGKAPDASYSFKKNYFEALYKYATLFKCDLKIAIYWVLWNSWTLIPYSRFKLEKDKYYISWHDAHFYNQMSLLGDFLVGTLPPLILKIMSNSSKSRIVKANGETAFTIGDVEFYCGNNRIEDKFEQNLAFYFMNYSDWLTEEAEAHIQGSELIDIEFRTKPQELIPEQNFQLLGTMSQMISREFNAHTVKEGSIERLSPSLEPSALGVVIPKNYKGKALKLWLLYIQPNDVDRVGTPANG